VLQIIEFDPDGHFSALRLQHFCKSPKPVSVFNIDTQLRHGRACPGHPRLKFGVGLKDVDARHKAGHDEEIGATI
jgi:hypothetical protein